VRLELREARGDRLIWTGILRESEPLPGNAPEDLAMAMNTALSRLANRAASEIAAAELPAS
jgi:hypothetical protein